MINYKKEIIGFIKKNDWKKIKNNTQYFSYIKDNNISIDIDDDEIVLIGDTGDFLHIQINDMALFTLLGYLFHYRYIDINYKF